MALTGLQIQKLLPGTNCKECGSNTCLAFAMKLAAKKADIRECPYATEDAIRTLGEATEPPVKKIRLGRDGLVTLGDETVLYRHEKTFVSRTAVAIDLSDGMDMNSFEKEMRRILDYRYERVGETFGVDMISLTHRNSESAFLSLVEKARSFTDLPFILRGDDAATLVKASALTGGIRSVLVSNGSAMTESLLGPCKAHGHAIALYGDIDSLVAESSKLREGGFTDIVLCFEAAGLSGQFQMNSIARNMAIRDSFKPLGFPSLRYVGGGPLEVMAGGATEILKYGGIMVLPEFDPAQLAAIFTMRLNIYTDPQKPIQVDPRLYAIGEPDEGSPLFVTTNFSLTYFVVSGEIENSGTSAWLLVPECEGMSVLTAWAAGKFNARIIAASLKENGVEEKLKNRKIVLPGYVSQISGELEELLPGWQVMVGPQEASDIESFVKNRLAG